MCVRSALTGVWGSVAEEQAAVLKVSAGSAEGFCKNAFFCLMLAYIWRLGLLIT